MSVLLVLVIDIHVNLLKMKLIMQPGKLETIYYIIHDCTLRYHGRWIFKKNAKNLFFAVQIEKTEKNNLQKEWRKKLFYFL